MNIRCVVLFKEYSMDCYFRQKWKDERLKFVRFATQSMKDVATISLSIKMLDKIWKPDTYFLNGELRPSTSSQTEVVRQMWDQEDELRSSRLFVGRKLTA